MAFTKTPAISTYQTKLLPVAGSVGDLYFTKPYFQSGATATAYDTGLKYINCLPLMQSQFGTDPTYTLTPRQRLSFRSQGGDAMGERMYTETFGGIEFVFTVGVYVSASPGGVQIEAMRVNGIDFLGGSVARQYINIPNGIRGVSTVTKFIRAGVELLCISAFVSGRVEIYYYSYDVPTGTFNYAHTTQLDADVILLPFGGILSLVSLDGYLFLSAGSLASGSNQRIYNSYIGDCYVWNTDTEFTDAEQYNDYLVQLAVHRNQLVAFGTSSVEFFYDAGNAVGTPLSRNTAYSRNIGTEGQPKNRQNICSIQDEIYFIGKDRGSDLGIYKISNSQIEKFSDFYIDSFFYNRRDTTVKRSGSLSACNLNGVYGILLCVVDTDIYGDPISTPQVFFRPLNSPYWCLLKWSYPLDFKFDTILGGVVSASSTFLLPDRKLMDSYHVMINAPYDPNNRLGQFREDANTYNCVYRTDIIDFANTNYKHFYEMELVGRFSNVNIRPTLLTTLGDPLELGFISLLDNSKTGSSQYPARWRNLGRYRRIRLIYNLVGTDANNDMDFVIEGLQLKYNQGTT